MRISDWSSDVCSSDLIAARAVGIATRAFEEAIRYSQERQAFGKPIAQHQAIQLKLAQMATKTEAARLLMIQAAQAKDRGEREIGRASGRERVWQYVSNAGAAVSFKKKKRHKIS